MADDDDEIGLLVHDALGHLEAAFIKVQDIAGSAVPGDEGCLCQRSERWRRVLADLVGEVREEHDRLAPCPVGATDG